MMALGWAPAFVRAVGFKLLNDLLKYFRHDMMKGPTYRLFEDMIALRMSIFHWDVLVGGFGANS